MSENDDPDTFHDDHQSDMFGYDAPPVYEPDPERVRRRLHKILAEAKAAQSLPASKLSLYRAIFPQMSFSLPDDEGAQLRFEFEEELERLEAA